MPLLVLVRRIVVVGQGRGELQAREAQRILPGEVIAEARLVLVALEHRDRAREAHLAQRVVDALPHDERLVVHVARRRHLPGLHHRVLRGELGAEELDGAHVLDGLRIDDGWNEARAGVAEDRERAVGERHRAEEARLGVGHRLDLAGGDLVAENIRHAGVVAAAIEVPAVAREHEALRHRLAEVELAHRFHVAREDAGELPHPHELVAVHLAYGGGQQAPVGRDVEIVGNDAIRKSVHLVPFRVRMGDAHQRCEAVGMAHAPERAVPAVEDELADARVLEQHARVAGHHVERHDVAQLVVVGRVERRLRVRVIGERGHLVEHRALHVGQALHRAVPRIQRSDVLEDSRITESAVEDAATLVVIGTRHRAHRRGKKVAVRSDRVFPHLGEVALLEVALEGDPVLPRALERDAEHVLELVRVVALAALVAPRPRDHVLGRVRVGEPGDEARAVEVGVDAHLEVHARAGGDERQRIVEGGAVAHHRAEHHLVVAALRAAQPAAHPRLEEDGEALAVPARPGEARHREVAVEERLGMLRLRQDLAAEESAPAALRGGVHVHGGDVHQLVVHERIHALAGGIGLEGERERRDVERERVAGRGARRGVAVIGEILEQDQRAVVGGPAEHALLPVERVLERADRVRREIGERIHVDEAHVLRLDERQAEGAFFRLPGRRGQGR